jgi:putative redox protein
MTQPTIPPIPERQGDGEGERRTGAATGANVPRGSGAFEIPARRRQVVRATWAGEHRFDSGRPDGPAARFDGSAVSGQSPVDALLSALASCSGIDVVDILAKRRTPVERLVVDVEADRRETPPRRLVRVEVHFQVDGQGIERVHAERAVQLAFEKYCSVSASLAPDTVIETRLTLNGESGDPVRQSVGAQAE